MVDTPRGTAVHWGTMLHAERLRILIPIRSLDSSIGIILAPTLWSWGRTNLQQERPPEIFMVVERNRRVGLTTPRLSLNRVGASTACYMAFFITFHPTLYFTDLKVSMTCA
jgi:hypothetical protein